MIPKSRGDATTVTNQYQEFQSTNQRAHRSKSHSRRGKRVIKFNAERYKSRQTQRYSDDESMGGVSEKETKIEES